MRSVASSSEVGQRPGQDERLAREWSFSGTPAARETRRRSPCRASGQAPGRELAICGALLRPLRMSRAV